MKARLFLALLVGSFSLGLHAKPIGPDWNVGSQPWSQTGIKMAQIAQEAQFPSYQQMASKMAAVASSGYGQAGCTAAYGFVGGTYGAEQGGLVGGFAGSIAGGMIGFGVCPGPSAP